MSVDNRGGLGHRQIHEGAGDRWAILVSLPVGHKRRDYVAEAENDDGVTPLSFATEDEARAFANGPKYRAFFETMPFSWRIAKVYEPLPPLWPYEPKSEASSAAPIESDAIRAARA